MSYKKQICQLIIEKMEWWRGATWAEHIDTRTKDEVITVMQNVVDVVANHRQKCHSKREFSKREKGEWMQPEVVAWRNEDDE